MKRYILLPVFLLLAVSPAFAQMKSVMVVDTPTAYTIGRGTYQVSFVGYDEGGMELKTFIGLHDSVFLGVSFDIEHTIGKEKPDPNIPGVVARIKFTDGWESFPLAVSIGYDSFFLNSTKHLNRMIYGPYFVFSRPIYLFNDEQYVSFGMRMPTQPHFVPEDTAYFLNLDVPLGQSFHLKTEVGKIYWDFHRPDEWMFNLGIEYCYLDQLGIEFDILFHTQTVPSRILKVMYHGEF